MRKIKERQYTGTKVSEMTQRERFGAEIARRAAAEGIVLLKNAMPGRRPCRYM